MKVCFSSSSVAYKQNFGLQIAEPFLQVVEKAKAEVLDTGLINPIVWHHTQNAIKKIKKTFPQGTLLFKQTPHGMIPLLQPYGKLHYYKKTPNTNPQTIELNTVLLSQGTIHGRDIRNLASELAQLEAKFTKSRKKYS